MTFGSLFAGIGGLDLGLERAGMECRWQVEIDPYATRVLARRWPDVRRHDDVRTFPPDDGTDWQVDLIAGGFPCQDISYAGKGAGLSGERSGLWFEFARVVRTLRPRFVLVENVPALLTRGIDAVLGTLATLGYDAERAARQVLGVASEPVPAAALPDPEPVLPVPRDPRRVGRAPDDPAGFSRYVRSHWRERRTALAIGLMEIRRGE